MLDELFPRREAAKKAGDDVASNAIKILMNSFYGVLGTPSCRFYNHGARRMPSPARAASCCYGRSAGSRQLVSKCSTATRTAYSSIRAPTIRLRRPNGARQLVVAFNGELAVTSSERWRVESRIELEFEKLYLKLFLPRARHSTRGRE
jgi:DNA polymerase-2